MLYFDLIDPVLSFPFIPSWNEEQFLRPAIVTSESSIAGRYGMGVLKGSTLQYKTAIKSGKYLLIFPGTPQETEKTMRKRVVVTTDHDGFSIKTSSQVLRRLGEICSDLDLIWQ